MAGRRDAASPRALRLFATARRGRRPTPDQALVLAVLAAIRHRSFGAGFATTSWRRSGRPPPWPWGSCRPTAPSPASATKSWSPPPPGSCSAVAIGCACDFLTPIGHQRNTLAMGPGGYRFGGYWRLGLPLWAIVAAVATALIPLFWPLT